MSLACPCISHKNCWSFLPCLSCSTTTMVVRVLATSCWSPTWLTWSYKPRMLEGEIPNIFMIKSRWTRTLSCILCGGTIDYKNQDPTTFRNHMKVNFTAHGSNWRLFQLLTNFVSQPKSWLAINHSHYRTSMAPFTRLTIFWPLAFSPRSIVSLQNNLAWTWLF